MLKICVIFLCAFCSPSIAVNKVKDYCNPNLCNGLKNTACNNTGHFSSICSPTIRLYRFNDTEKTIMLDSLNYLRSTIALGSAYNASGAFFPPAIRMSKIQWDPEQEFMASLQIKTCIHDHDPCKNTWFNTSYFNFCVYIGQNIYYESSYDPNRRPMDQIIQSAANVWFNEILIAPTTEANDVQNVPGFIVGHFLVMSHDMAQRVGCVASQWQTVDAIGTNSFTQLTCNFFKSPMLSEPLYDNKPNKFACDGCVNSCDWTSDTPGLCVINPASYANTYYWN